jgi:hypothetical protein
MDLSRGLGDVYKRQVLERSREKGVRRKQELSIQHFPVL